MLLGGLLGLSSEVGGGGCALEIAREHGLDEGVEDNLGTTTLPVSYMGAQ